MKQDEYLLTESELKAEKSFFNMIRERLCSYVSAIGNKLNLSQWCYLK